MRVKSGAFRTASAPQCPLGSIISAFQGHEARRASSQLLYFVKVDLET